jgi:hypothetical protein
MSWSPPSSLLSERTTDSIFVDSVPGSIDSVLRSEEFIFVIVPLGRHYTSPVLEQCHQDILAEVM